MKFETNILISFQIYFKNKIIKIIFLIQLEDYFLNTIANKKLFIKFTFYFSYTISILFHKLHFIVCDFYSIQKSI